MKKEFNIMHCPQAKSLWVSVLGESVVTFFSFISGMLNAKMFLSNSTAVNNLTIKIYCFIKA